MAADHDDGETKKKDARGKTRENSITGILKNVTWNEASKKSKAKQKRMDKVVT